MKQVLDYGNAATASGRRMISFASTSVFAGLTAASLVAIALLRPTLFDDASVTVVKAYWVAIIALVLVGGLTGCIGCTARRGRRLSIVGVILNGSIPIVVGLVIWWDLKTGQ